MSARRGACPALAAPMATGDGLLARLIPAGGTIALDQMSGLCAAARRHGNGILEITSRGNLQIRGLTTDSAPAFAAAVAQLGIDHQVGVPVLTNPLAGLDPDEIIDARPLADALRAALSEAGLAAALSPKASVVIDGGGALTLDAVAADVRLRAVQRDGDVFWEVNSTKTTPERAVDSVVRLLQGPTAREVSSPSPRWGEGRGEGVKDRELFLPPKPLTPSLSQREREEQTSDAIGIHGLRGGRVALGVGLAFGHAQAANLEQLMAEASCAGAKGIRPAPGRALLLIGIPPEQTTQLGAAAERLGFIVRADDPRRHIAACAGAPICSSGLMAARALAPEVAAAAAPLLDGSLVLHLSGCPKGCAHAGAAALTIVGAPNGVAVVAAGRAGDPALCTVPTGRLAAAMEDLTTIVMQSRRPGETSADALARLGPRRIADAVHV